MAARLGCHAQNELIIGRPCRNLADSRIAVHKVINYNSAVNKGHQPKTYVFGIEFGGQNDKKDGQMPIFFLLNSLCCWFQFRLHQDRDWRYSENSFAVVGADRKNRSGHGL
jgi:hypothetical protein